MPDCGSQIILCDLPVRFDTYKGCSHGCSYCFVSRKADISQIATGESVAALRSWIAGKRTGHTSWCDWDIPLHWGGMSDPFQPAERVKGRSLEALRVFAETQYPFVVSTKSALVAEEPYFSLIKQCNCVVQFSIVTPEYDKIEKGASTYKQRLEAARKIAEHKRVIFRLQPYIPGAFRQVLNNLREFAEAGVYGIVVEAMKYTKPRLPELVPVGNDYVYPLSVLLPQFRAIREAAHKVGMKFYAGENRLRSMGDDLCCCGVDGMGWRTNKANLNHALYDKDNFAYTEKMRRVGTADCFDAKMQSTMGKKVIEISSYADLMGGAIRRPYPYQESIIPRFTKDQAEQMRRFLRAALNASGKRAKDIDKHLGTNGMAGHYFGASQWSFPTEDAYNKMREIMPLPPIEECLAMVGIREKTGIKIYNDRK